MREHCASCPWNRAYRELGRFDATEHDLDRWAERSFCTLRRVPLPAPRESTCANHPFHHLDWIDYDRDLAAPEWQGRFPDRPLGPVFSRFGAERPTELPWHGERPPRPAGERRDDEPPPGPCAVCKKERAGWLLGAGPERLAFCSTTHYLAWWRRERPGESPRLADHAPGSCLAEREPPVCETIYRLDGEEVREARHLRTGEWRLVARLAGRTAAEPARVLALIEAMRGALPLKTAACPACYAQVTEAGTIETVTDGSVAAVILRCPQCRQLYRRS